MAGDKKLWLHPGGNGKASVFAYSPQAASQQLLLKFDQVTRAAGRFLLILKINQKAAREPDKQYLLLLFCSFQILLLV